MADVFEGEIDRLAALQAIDREIKERQDEIAALSGEVAGFEAELNQYRDEQLQLQRERDAHETQRAELEVRLRAEEAKIKGSRMRMTRIRNERELLAMQHEINVSKEANQQTEEQLLVLMEHIENMDRRLGEIHESLGGLEGEAAQVIASRQARVREIDQDLATRLAQRETLVVGMNASLRSKYEQLFARRGGSAVVEVRNGTCLGCHMHVPPQLFNELQKFRDVRQCPNCRRILYWRPEGADDAAPNGA